MFVHKIYHAKNKKILTILFFNKTFQDTCDLLQERYLGISRDRYIDAAPADRIFRGAVNTLRNPVFRRRSVEQLCLG